MNSPHCQRRRLAVAALAALLLAVAPGCVHLTGGEETLFNSLRGIDTVVVAPMMNLSTSSDVNTIEVTNAFASELQQVEGVNVVPLGRVYQYLAANKMQTVGSPGEARGLAKAFGAQATIVGAVTEYDPYDPPRMGLAVQLYAASGDLPAPEGSTEFDPVRSARQAAPFPVEDDPGNRPRDMLSRVYSGRDAEVEHVARTYARQRGSDASPYGWRRFIVDQREFQRLCSYAIIREMMGAEGRRKEPRRLSVGSVPSDHPR